MRVEAPGRRAGRRPAGLPSTPSPRPGGARGRGEGPYDPIPSQLTWRGSGVLVVRGGGVHASREGSVVRWPPGDLHAACHRIQWPSSLPCPLAGVNGSHVGSCRACQVPPGERAGRVAGKTSLFEAGFALLASRRGGTVCFSHIVTTPGTMWAIRKVLPIR